MGSEQLVVHELRLQPELDLSYLIEECHHNQNPQECTKLYDIWSETYDDVVVKVGYHGPELLVQVCLPHLMKVLAAKQEAKILEIGCGSGATGRLLMDAVQSHAGSDAWASVHLDGTDGSRGMLDKARNQDPQVYHALYQDILLEDKPSEVLPAETYDIVMGCGIFSQGHMSAEYIHHFITAAKKTGGLIIFGLCEKWFIQLEMKKVLDRYESAGTIRPLEKLVLPHYTEYGSGTYFVYERA